MELPSPTFWSRLRLCMDGICEPVVQNGGHECQYAKYSKDRTTSVKTIKTPVDRDYAIHGVLGKGAFGLVREGIHRTSKRKIAMKFVERRNLSERDERLFLTEAGILSGLSHGNVVSMLDLYKGPEAYCLTMEHMGGGELFDDILRRNFYTEACARRIILQILDALCFLHRRGIVHRDVKPENLLLPRVGSEDIKLADFGFATVLSPPTFKVVDPVGTPGYAAPELLRLMPYDGKVDVFSVGVISFVLLAGRLPFEGATVKEVVRKTLVGDYHFDDFQWTATSEDAHDFVRSLLSTSPNARPAAHEALTHPWMKASGRQLRSHRLSHDGSGNFKEQLEELQQQRQSLKNMKTVVGVVLAANRLRKILETADAVGDEQFPLDSDQETCSTVDGSSEIESGRAVVA